MLRIVLSMSFLLASAIGYASCPQGGLVVGWDPYEPFQMEKNNQVTGLDIEIIQQIAARLKCPIVYKKRPWKRLLAEIKSGVVHVTGSASKNPEREGFSYFSAPYVSQKNYLYVVKNLEQSFATFKSLADVIAAKKKVGITIGYEYGSEFAKLQADKASAAFFDAAPDEKTSVAKLDIGRIDAVIMNEFTGAVAVADSKVKQQVVALPIVVTDEELHFILSKKSVSPDFLQAFTTEFKNLEKSGEINRLAAKYRLH